MAKLPDVFSTGKPVVVDDNGHPVRPVDVNGVALDDSTVQFSTAHPVVEVDSTGTAVNDSTQVFSTARKVKIDTKGHPVITIGTGGTALGTTLGIGGGGVVSLAATYDTSMGLSVDTNARTDLTPKTGAHIIYVNSTTGNDTNADPTNPSTPVATIKKGYSFVVDGRGDHVLIAQGMAYNNGFASIGDKGGFSAQYPLTFQSYDPADPTNQAKWGTATGSNRPDINMSSGSDNSGGFIQGSGASKSYRAFRGLKFDGNDVSNVFLNVLPNTTGIFNYTLFESCEFAQVQLSVEGDNTVGNIRPFYKLIFRNCSSHGQWDSTGGGRSQGLFVNTGDGITVEDSIFWRAGWKEGALRTDPASSGGPSNQAHSMYFQDDTRNAIARRNVFIDNSFEGIGQMKGGGIATGNLILRNPQAGSLGGGNNYTVDAPLGVYADLSYNVVIGAGPSTDTGDWGLHLNNAKLNNADVHHNVLAHSGVAGAYALMIDASNDVLTDPAGSSEAGWPVKRSAAAANPSWGSFYNNVSYLWSPSGSSKAIGLSGGNVGLITSTFNNNIWDDPTSGTNTNNGSVSFPNAYTESTLLAALPGAYPDEATAIADWIAHPEQHGWRNAIPLGLAGYGVTVGLQDLKTNTTLTVGVPTSGMFIGTIDGSTLTATGLPTGVTLDSGGRCWRYDGTGTAGTASSTITESNGAFTHNTALTWNIYAQPVLSSQSVTPSTTTATASVSTNVGSGTLYWMVSTKSTAPDWAHVRQGIDADQASAGISYGSQAISATGAQSITGISGLTASTAYNLYTAQLDGNGNPSATSATAFSTIASGPPATNIALDFTNLSMSNLYTDTAATTNVTADGQTVKAIKDPTSGIVATNSTGWVYNANSGHPYLSSTGTSAFTTTTSVTYADATGQFAVWTTLNISGSGNFLALYASGNLLAPNGTTGGTNAYVRSSSAQLATAFSLGTSLNTDQVYLGLVTGTSGTSGNVEAFVNNVDSGGSGAVAWSGTPKIADTLRINQPTSAAGRFYGLLIAKGDQTANRSAMQTYMAALHP